MKSCWLILWKYYYVKDPEVIDEIIFKVNFEFVSPDQQSKKKN